MWILLGVVLAGCDAGQDRTDASSADSGPPVEFRDSDATVDDDDDGYAAEVDCNDHDWRTFPGADERCNGLDDDCDGVVGADELDEDGDSRRVCEGDCDDHDATIWPNATELCDGRDQDCDGIVKDEVDGDGDGYVACADDCDGADPRVHPGAAELCDGIDDDCDGALAPAEGDADGDGHYACGDDCDDADALRHGGATERCGDGVDQDCDGDPDGDCLSCTRSVPADHPTIQAAIDASTNGDVVCVSAGTYTENLDYSGHEIDLVGVDGADLTVLDGGGLGSVVSFVSGEGPAAVLRGFTVRNGIAALGGGLRVVGASPTLEDLVITGNKTSDPEPCGGGVYVSEGEPSFSHLRIHDNWAYYTFESTNGYYVAKGSGGGVCLVDAAATFDNVEIADNLSVLGAGLHASGATVTLRHARVRGNLGSGGGTGLFLSDSSGVFENVLIADNVAEPSYYEEGSLRYGGGGLYLLESEATLANILMDENLSTEGGGAAGISSSTVSFTNAIFVANEGLDAALEAGKSTTTVSWSDYWINSPADVAGVTDGPGTNGNTGVAPLLFDTVGHLARLSPLIDAGDPGLLDPDATVSDPGLFGGPGASGWDLDGDGFFAWWAPGPYSIGSGLDCDDDHPGRHPGSGC